MLNDAQVKKYLTGMIHKLEYPDTEVIIDVAVPIGIAEFWGMYPWQDRLNCVDYVVSTPASTYKLPKDFDSIVSIVHQEEATGGKLIRLIKEDFDQKFPLPTYHASGVPCYYTIFKDNHEWKVSFAPRPASAMTFPLRYHTQAPSSLTALPSKLQACALAFILKNCYPMLSMGRQTAYTQAVSELELAKNADKESSADITFFPTEQQGAYQAEGDAPWLPGWNNA